MTAMRQAFVCLLLLQGWSTTVGKYVYVEQGMSWDDAQSYCREFHTDLAPVVGDDELRKLFQLSGYVTHFWTGLVRNDTDKRKWAWSGGGPASTILWEDGQPDDWLNEDVGMMINYRMHNANRHHHAYFFCYDAIVVRESASWEEALERCRGQDGDLASVTSQTEMLLIQRELEKNLSTEHVWMGLRYFPGGWRWVDKEDLTYEAWVGDEGAPLCPAVKLRCGALKVAGWMESNDPDARSNITLGGAGLGTDDAFMGQSVWEARDCEQELHFICY